MYPAEPRAAGSLGLEDGELMPQREDLRLEFEARPKRTAEGGEQQDKQGRRRQRTVSAPAPDLQREEDVLDSW